jgi:multidrug efflux system outer membrane protein
MKASSTVQHPATLPRLAGTVLALALAGCAHVPPDSSKAVPPDFARAQHAPEIRLARDAWPTAQWWLDYHDPQLDQLVELALKDSPTLAAAQARVLGAQAALGAERAAGGVQLGLDAGLIRQRYSGNGLFPAPIGGAFYNDASVKVQASYDFDWWGKHRSLVAAALGEVNARQAEASQARQTLAAALAQSYFRLQLLWARLDNTNALAALQRELIADRKARIAHGLANADEQRTAELDLGTITGQAARLATQAGREREALRALAGAGSGALGQLAHHAPVAPVAALPRQLGLELLARRPDLQAARWRVEAALGRVAASQAAFYPDLNLVGAFGLDAVSIGRLLRPGSRTLLAGAVLELPLFDSGRLDAQLGAARAERDAMIADYNQSVLDAVRDVAAEGVTLQGIEQQTRAHAATSAATTALLGSASARFQRGLADRSALLQAKLAVLRQQDGDLQLQDAALQTQVALVKALGGGYRAEPVRTAAASTAAASTSPQQH